MHTAVEFTGTSCVQGQRYDTEHVLDLGSGLLALLSFVLNCIGCHRFSNEAQRARYIGLAGVQRPLGLNVHVCRSYWLAPGARKGLLHQPSIAPAAAVSALYGSAAVTRPVARLL